MPHRTKHSTPWSPGLNNARSTLGRYLCSMEACTCDVLVSIKQTIVLKSCVKLSDKMGSCEQSKNAVEVICTTAQQSSATVTPPLPLPRLGMAIEYFFIVLRSQNCPNETTTEPRSLAAPATFAEQFSRTEAEMAPTPNLRLRPCRDRNLN